MPTTQPLPRDPTLDAEAFWFRYRREIFFVIVLVLLGAAAWGAYQFYKTRRNEAAAVELAAAKSPQDYEQLTAKYGDTPAAASARLLLAEAQRKDGKFAESSATLQAFVDKNPEHELVPTAKMAIASNLETTGKADEALSLYQQIASKYAKSFAAPLALMSQVPLLKAKNQTDQARRVCETVLSQYSDSFWANDAMRELRNLRPPETPGAAAPAKDAAGPALPPSQARPPMRLPPGPAPAVPPRATVAPKPK